MPDTPDEGGRGGLPPNQPPPSRSYFLGDRRRRPRPFHSRAHRPDARSKLVTAVVRDGERAVMLAAADAAGLTLSTWMRNVLLREVGLEP
jgi:hypothetical protein